MRKLWLLGLAVTLALTASAAAPPPSSPLRMASLETYRDVLPQQTVRSLLQDRDGYLWIGTWDGLVRSNGVDFRVFRRPDGLPNDSVTALLEDREGVLWVGTNEGLAFRKGGVFEPFRGNGRLPDLLVTSLSEDGSGGLLVGTQSGLCHVVGGRVHLFEGQAGAPAGPIHGMAPLADRVLLTTDDGVLSHGPGGFRDEGRLRDEAGSLPLRLRSILTAPDGTVYAGTDGRGVARRKGSEWSVLGTEIGLPTLNAKFLFLDPSGTLWVGTEGFGVCAVREPGGPSPRTECLGRTEGLTSGVVRSLLVDVEGTLWVGTANGLNAVRHQRFQVLGSRHGLPEENVRNVLESRAGELWLGTDGAGVVRVSGDRVDTWGRSQGLASDLIRSLGEDAGGRIWAGTNGAGVSVLDPRTGRIQTFDSGSGLSGDLVLSIHRARDGSMWLGNDRGFLDVFRSGRWERRAVLPDEAGQPTPLRTFLIREGRDGAIWLGTSRGLCRLSGESSQRFSQGLGAREVYAMHELGRGTALVAAAGGLFLFSGGSFQRVRGREGDWDFTVFEILEDLRGDLWLTSNRGVVHVGRQAVEAYAAGTSRELLGRTFDESDGLTTRQCNGSTSPAGARGGDGRLYIPTNRGLAIVDPGREEAAAPAPRVVIAGALLDGVRAFGRLSLVVEPHVRRVEILYDAPTFLGARRLLFQFRLEGYDGGWIDAGAARSASYTSLPPGGYVFHVRCGTPTQGFPEEGVALRVTVEPRLHQRGWVQVLAGVLLVAAVAGLVRLRIRRLALLARELEETVRSRTAELSEANDRLLDANARLGAANQELRHLGEERAEFLGIAAHDLKSPLSVVVGYAHLLQQAGLAPGEKLLVDRIMGACGRMRNLIEDLLGESALEQGSMTVDLERLDVAELVRAGLKGHREAAEAKGQRILEDLPQEEVTARTDRHILGQVLDNLVSNAVKFSPRGTTIRVRVARRQGRVRLEVEDEGPGLTERDRERLFKRFARLSARPTGGEGSTGLGLSIVAKLAELLGARITCESEPGNGATFTFELPAERPSA